METTEILLVICLFNTVLLLLLLVFGRKGGKEREQESRLFHLENGIQSLEKGLDKLEQTVRAEVGRNREETGKNAQLARQELSASLKSFTEYTLSSQSNISMMQKSQLETFANQLAKLTEMNEQKLEAVRRTVEEKLNSLQEDNGRKLEQMRATVDEKLNTTLEKRLGESFKLVSDRLEQVYKGLGEMQVLAAGVGDLKKVLTNVKTRGIWGEIQLGNILEQILTPDQYCENTGVSAGGGERVEYAIRLPGKGDNGREVLLPIDAKFPLEDYQKFVSAHEQGNPAMADEASKQLELRIRTEAKRISEKYINPPYTTDFAIMFLPTESLYAEVTKKAGLLSHLQETHRVVIAGPSTTAAILNSLSMGFRTLAIQKRSSEVWMLLGAIKTEFGKFGGILEKTQKKLQDASSTIDEAARRSRAIERRLRSVEELPGGKVPGLLEEIAAAEDTNGISEGEEG